MSNHLIKNWAKQAAMMITALFCLAGVATAQDNPFQNGWTLQSERSSLNFQSIKKKTVVESSGFATLRGEIEENGEAEVTVLLDSVDTKIDLRNVRMRFLFFETALLRFVE